MGQDAAGNPVRGRTWVRGHLRWRDRPPSSSTIYVKSSIAVAKAKAAALIGSNPSAFSLNVDIPDIGGIIPEPETDIGWLYVMRCPLMENDVYKVGWTAKLPADRAEELSKSTGVPLAFIVVESWNIDNPRLIEKLAHEALSAYRVSGRREFFKAPYETIRREIAAAISTTNVILN
jgi:hypothetical protein